MEFFNRWKNERVRPWRKAFRMVIEKMDISRRPGRGSLISSFGMGKV